MEVPSIFNDLSAGKDSNADSGAATKGLRLMSSVVKRGRYFATSLKSEDAGSEVFERPRLVRRCAAAVEMPLTLVSSHTAKQWMVLCETSRDVRDSGKYTTPVGVQSNSEAQPAIGNCPTMLLYAKFNTEKCSKNRIASSHESEPLIELCDKSTVDRLCRCFNI